MRVWHLTDKKIIWIGVVIALFLSFGIKCNRNIENFNLTSGGEGDHWYHSSGYVLEKKDSFIKVKIDNGKNKDKDFMDGDILELDCRKCPSEMINAVSINDNVLFYYWRENIENKPLIVEYVSLE